MNRKWVKTKAVFSSELEDLGIEPSLNERLAPFRFDLNEVIAYNESSTDGWSTIWFNGSSITITISVKELDEMLAE